VNPVKPLMEAVFEALCIIILALPLTEIKII